MARILIDPLGVVTRMALAVGDAIIRSTQSQASDRAIALTEAFEVLKICEPIEEIVVLNGPGNFTSIRAGIGFARGLGLAYGAKTRGISILEVDHQLSDGAQHILRDARGGRVYHGEFKSGMRVELMAVPTKDASSYASFDEIEGVTLLSASDEARMEALLKLAQNDRGAMPASAFYVRAADALPSNIVPPKIWDAQEK